MSMYWRIDRKSNRKRSTFDMNKIYFQLDEQLFVFSSFYFVSFILLEFFLWFAQLETAMHWFGKMRLHSFFFLSKKALCFSNFFGWCKKKKTTEQCIKWEKNNRNGQKGRHKKYIRWINKNEPNACDSLDFFRRHREQRYQNRIIFVSSIFFFILYTSHLSHFTVFCIQFHFPQITCRKRELKTNKELRQIARELIRMARSLLLWI